MLDKNTDNDFTRLCIRKYGKDDIHPKSAFHQMAAYLHQDYAIEAKEYLVNNPSIIEMVDEFWGKSYSDSLHKIHNSLIAEVSPDNYKGLDALQIALFFNSINNKSVGDLAQEFHSSVVKELKEHLKISDDEDISEELCNKYGFDVLVSRETLQGALKCAQRLIF